MSMYLPGIPTGTVNLDEDYLNLQHNFTQLNVTYGTDHYAYDDQTANNGFHNTVTTPLIVGAAHPATAADVPKFYAMQDTVPLGVIHYSRAGNNAVPSPVTYRQSPSTPIILNIGNTTPLMNFAGLSRAIVKIFAGDFTNPMSAAPQPRVNELTAWWNGTTFSIPSVPAQGNAIVVRVVAASSLELFNNTSGPGTNFLNVYWTMQFLRLQV